MGMPFDDGDIKAGAARRSSWRRMKRLDGMRALSLFTRRLIA